MPLPCPLIMHRRLPCIGSHTAMFTVHCRTVESCCCPVQLSCNLDIVIIVIRAHHARPCTGHATLKLYSYPSGSFIRFY